MNSKWVKVTKVECFVVSKQTKKATPNFLTVTPWFHFLQTHEFHNKNTTWAVRHFSSDVFKKWINQILLRQKLKRVFVVGDDHACRQTVARPTVDQQSKNNKSFEPSLQIPPKSQNTTQLERETQLIISPTRRWRLCVLSQTSTQFSPFKLTTPCLLVV